MKTLLCGATISLAALAGGAAAEQTLVVDGIEYPLSALMATCLSETKAPAEQIACVNDLTRLMAQQDAAEADPDAVPRALAALREAAEYRGDETGLLITGEGCSLRVVYFGNYFHLSRRNISAIDAIGVTFDAARVSPDRVVDVPGGLARGAMEPGATALVSGGIGLESAQQGFAPKSPRIGIAEYADEVLAQLPAQAVSEFQFVMVHPMRREAGDDIWNAFRSLVTACKRGGPELPADSLAQSG